MLESVWLVHPEEAMCAAFRDRFAGLPNVRVIRGRLEDLEPHDCFVTAGNALGLMTAGIDAAVVRVFGEGLMRRVQHRILDQFFGEQPVGTAFLVPTGHPNVPFLVHAPTMRVPGSIEGTDKVYSATWAALLAIQAHNATAERKEGKPSDYSKIMESVRQMCMEDAWQAILAQYRKAAKIEINLP